MNPLQKQIFANTIEQFTRLNYSAETAIQQISKVLWNEHVLDELKLTEKQRILLNEAAKLLNQIRRDSNFRHANIQAEKNIAPHATKIVIQ